MINFTLQKNCRNIHVKNVDQAVLKMAKTLDEEGKISEKSLSFGLADNGVGLADIRVIKLTPEQQAAIKKLKKILFRVK